MREDCKPNWWRKTRNKLRPCALRFAVPAWVMTAMSIKTCTQHKKTVKRKGDVQHNNNNNNNWYTWHNKNSNKYREKTFKGEMKEQSYMPLCSMTCNDRQLLTNLKCLTVSWILFEGVHWQAYTVPLNIIITCSQWPLRRECRRMNAWSVAIVKIWGNKRGFTCQWWRS